MNVLNSKDIEILKQMRTNFLTFIGNKTSDYWHNETFINLYHITFAQRIAWKLNFVYDFIKNNNHIIHNNINKIVDFGCGSGIATNCFFDKFLELKKQITEIILFDRSNVATTFAKRKLNGLSNINTYNNISFNMDKNTIILASHLINELSEQEQINFINQLMQSGFFIWVEPGSKTNSQLQTKYLEQIKKNFIIIEPCLSQNICPIHQRLLNNNTNDWCHFYTPPPQEVFHSKFWHDFSIKLSIDLRSLPVSFLVGISKTLYKNDLINKYNSIILAKPKINKKHIEIITCSKNNVCLEKIIVKEKDNIDLFKLLKKEKNIIKI